MLTNDLLSFLKGIDRSVAPLLADRSSLYILRNLRHTFEQRGVLEQTPSWYNQQQFTQGTYYDGGSQTEATGSAIRLLTEDLVVTDYVCRTPAGQAQVFYQSVDTATINVNTGCRLVINSISGLAITLGSTLEVDIDGATTFRWRKNGGAYTSLVAIASEVSIDGGNATLYFLATSGFTIGTTWTWTRTDASFADNSGTFEYPLIWNYYKSNLYFNSVDDRMMMMTTDTGGTRYVISIGYRPVVGAQACFFDDHLVVGWFNTAESGWTASNRHRVVGWSDKTDVHNFIPTDLNEADQYTLPNTTLFDITGSSPESFITGVDVAQQQLFILTNNEMYTTGAYGLPLVFSFVKYLDLKTVATYYSTIRAEGGFYILGYNEIYFFNGVSLTPIGAAVIQGTENNNFDGTFGVWDPFRRELNIVFGELLYVFQEKWQTWYVRRVGFDATDNPATAINSYDGTLRCGGASRKRFYEDKTGVQQPAYDDAGAAYAEPYLVTQLFGGSLRTIKEISSVHVGAITDSTGADATYYTKDGSVTYKLSWYNCPAGDFTGISEETHASASITDTTASSIIPYPRLSFRSLALALEIQGTSTKPPFGAKLYQLIPRMDDPDRDNVEK